MSRHALAAAVLCAGCLLGLTTRPVAAATAEASLVIAGTAPVTATSAAAVQPQWTVTQTVQLVAPTRSLQPIPPASDPVCAENIAAAGAAATGLLAFVSGQADSRMLPALPIACGARSGWALPVPRVSRASGPRAHAPSGAGALHLPAYVPIGASSSDTLDLGSYISMAIKFAIVMVLIFVCLRVLRAVMPRLQGRTPGSGGGTLLHSQSVGAKQTVQVIDLGVRVLVVGVTPTAMTPLATIDSPEEIAALRAHYRTPATLASVDDTDGEEGGTRISFARALSNTMSVRARGGRRQAAESDGDEQDEQEDDDGAEAGDRDPILDRALTAMRSLRSRTQRS